MKKRYAFLSLVALTSLLAISGCKREEEKPKPDPDPTPNPEPDKPIDEKLFGNLLGKFNGALGEVTFTKDAFTLKGESNLSLIPSKIEKETKNGFSRSVVYFKDQNYSANLSFDEKMTLKLNKKNTSNSYDEIGIFYPDIKAISGAYGGTSFDDLNEGNLTYTISDDYSKSFDGYRVSASVRSTFSDTGYYVKSYFTLINNEEKLALDMYGNDKTIWHSITPVKEEKGITLSYFDKDKVNDVLFYSNASFLNATYLDESNNKLTYTITENEDFTYSIKKGDVALSLKITYDDDGLLYSLTGENYKEEIRKELSGVEIKKDNTSTYYAFDSFDNFIGTFKNNDLTFTLYETYDDDFNSIYKTMIDSKPVDYVETIYNKEKALKITLDSKIYYFVGEMQGISIKSYQNDQLTYLVNYNDYEESFINSFVSKDFDTKDEIKVSEGLKVNYLNGEATGELCYEEGHNNLGMKFTLNSKLYYFDIYDLDNQGFSLNDGEITKYFYSQSKLDYLVGEYTSHHEVELVITKDEVTYLGTTYKYKVSPYYDEDLSTNMVGIYLEDDNDLIATTSTGVFAHYDLVDNKPDKESVKYFVSYQSFLDFVGTYSFAGKFGVENITLTSDGKFYADTVNASGTGLDKNVEYDYTLGVRELNEKMTMYVSFIYKDTALFCYKGENSITITGLDYYRDYLFNYFGVYSDGTNALYFIGNNLYLNGSKVYLSDISHDESSTTLSSSSDTFKFSDTKVEISGSQNLNLTYTDFDMSKFKGEYSFSDGRTLTFKEKYSEVSTTTQIGYVLTNGSYLNLDPIVCYYKGKLALSFKDGLSTYYIYQNDEGKNVSDLDAGTLPPPPPPIL